MLREFTTQKSNSIPNEDFYEISKNGRAFAMSDGASISFDSKNWASILVRRFLETPKISKHWIEAAADSYDSLHDRENMPWMQQGAFDRGSFATLLGLEFFPDATGVRVFAIGDTILVLLDNGRVVKTIPYICSDEFDKSPILISTNPVENRTFDDETLSGFWQDLNLSSHETPTLLIMTDALGRWLLERPDSEGAAELMRLSDQHAFQEFVDRERASGRMHRDDTTLVIFGEP